MILEDFQPVRAQLLYMPIMTFFRKYSPLLLLLCIHSAQGKPERTSIEVYVERAKDPLTAPNITVPPETTELRFYITPKSLRVRFKLEGIDREWRQPAEEMKFEVRFIKKNGDPILQSTFPVHGQSHGWNGSVEQAQFTARRELISVPEGAEYLYLAMSPAGPAPAVGMFAISQITITALGSQNPPPQKFLVDSRVPGSVAPFWIKGGTHPSMASSIHLEDGSADSPVFVIVDDDITAHADWATGIFALPKVVPGQTLEVKWKEAYSISNGGNFSANYERLPAGTYHFIVEDLAISGEPLAAQTSVTVVVPRPYWKHLGFWVGCALTITILSTLAARHFIRRRINRHLQQAQLITDERLRIARDLHDDLGTRLSHISLLGAHAESTIADLEARATFHQITDMTSELISALSETVWMLNSKNNDLEALVNFLCRLVSELCRLSDIRCRIDAMSVDQSMPISHEFRHNFSLSVKESVNNALRHSCATEIKIKIWLEGNVLKITIADNGIGITSGANKRGSGLESITQRMTHIRGKCLIEALADRGLRVSLEAPIS